MGNMLATCEAIRLCETTVDIPACPSPFSVVFGTDTSDRGTQTLDPSQGPRSYQEVSVTASQSMPLHPD